MDLHHSSCWEAILEKVKPHIPTMDFDSSSSENEEIATIYQRPAGLSLTVSEDFDLLSMDDDHLERLWKPVAPTRRTEESEQLDGDENVEGSTVTQRQLADVEGDAPQTGPVESDASVRPNNTQTTTTTAADQQLTVLSLARFDQWDLDDVLKNLDRLPLQQHVSVEPLETHADGDKEKSEAIIMERLVAFCDIQSSKNESEPMESPNHIKHTNVGNKSSGSLEDELRPRQKECPTVYIDLRCSDSSIKTPRTSPNPPSESKSPAKRSKHHETPKKVNLKVHHASCTDDSDQQRPEVKQTNAREQHQQIPEQLERHRPLKSVNQKRPAAEKTNVLYDSEASHLQSISTLPTGLESKGRMLLIVDLSSPGAVGSRAHGKRKHRISAATKSHTYNTLVAWFLSSVGRPLHDEDEAAAKVPFWVAGLQQQWTDDGLALFVLVVARHSYTPKKRNKDIHTPFYNHVCSFLTETSLPLIASWVPAVRNLLDQQAFASPIHLPSCSLNGFISTTSNKKVIDRTFGLDPGFYWQTLETPEHVCRGRETTQALHTDVSVAVRCDAFILHPVKTHYTLQLVLDSGLDVCGLRLLYPTQEFLSDRAGAGPVLQRADATCQPVLALAVRGLRAHSVLCDLTSSSDPLVPGGTNPLEPPLFFSSRPASQVHRELCLWFSGRVSPYNRLPSRVVPSNERRGVFLCATTKTDLLLVVSPAVPPCCFGQVLAVCERRGFGLGGLQRLRLQSNGAADLGLSEQQARVFCIPRRGQLELLLPCLVLLLRKENAVHHTVCLPAALMREFKTRKLLGRIRSRVDGVRAAEPSLCFHTAPYSSNLYHVFVQCMWAVPDPSSVILSHPKSSSNSDMAILTFCGKDTRRGLSLLHRVLTEEPEGFQLLGLKWLPALTRLQARELNPHEVGQQLFQDRVGHLMPRPALVCALERADALASLRKLLPQDYPGDLSVLMSPTPEVAFRQASLFFFEHEMIADLQMLVTLCLFKPTIWNHSLAKIAHKLQLCGLTMVGLRGLTLDKRTATSLLPAQSDPSDLEAHVGYLGSGSSLALCLRGGKCCKQAAGCAGPRCLVTVDPSWRGSFIQWHLWIRITSESDSGREEFFSRGALLHRDQRNETGADTQRALGPVGLCGARTELHSGPGGPGEGFTFKGIGTQHSALWQTTFLLIPLNAPPLHPAPSQLEALEQLLRSGCHLVAGRMSILDEEQRKHIAEALKGPSRGKERAARLRAAPCLVVALQGDAIVTDFDSILERIYKERQELQKVGEMIVYPECHKEANQLIRYLFDDLSGETRHHM